MNTRVSIVQSNFKLTQYISWEKGCLRRSCRGGRYGAGINSMGFGIRNSDTGPALSLTNCDPEQGI